MKRRNAFALFFAGLLIVGCATARPGTEDANIGYAYLTRGQYAEAESYFRRALYADPRNPYALLDLGVVYQYTGRIDKAREMYRKVIDTGAQDIPKLINKKEIRGKTLSQIARDNLSALPVDEEGQRP